MGEKLACTTTINRHMGLQWEGKIILPLIHIRKKIPITRRKMLSKKRVK